MKVAWAVSINPSDGKGGTILQSIPNFGVLVGKILSAAGIIAGIVLIFMIIYSGFQFMTSSGTGDAKKIMQAQTLLLDAIIGFLIIIATYLIIQLVTALTGVPILNANI